MLAFNPKIGFHGVFCWVGDHLVVYGMMLVENLVRNVREPSWPRKKTEQDLQYRCSDAPFTAMGRNSGCSRATTTTMLGSGYLAATAAAVVDKEQSPFSYLLHCSSGSNHCSGDPLWFLAGVWPIYPLFQWLPLYLPKILQVLFVEVCLWIKRSV